ncbi:DUF1758 domain-containing protein [Trichonephila clavipes]|nr:DUF1758 domain-containing protein [Trichonephila clavipes]
MVVCDHYKVIDYFLATIPNHYGCKPVGVACDSWENFVAGKCSDCAVDGSQCAIMGFQADKKKELIKQHPPRKFYLYTGVNPPFCEQLKKELELTNAKCKLSPAQEKSEHFESVPSDIENLIKSIKTLTIPVPSNTEAYNLFFQLLEKAFKTKNVEDKFKAEILLNMLGEKVGNLMIYVKQEELGDYEKIKQLVLKQFQPTPRVLLNQFRRSQKLPNENYVQFASRIEAMFDYYCKLRNVNEFNELCQLIVADQIINSLDQELTSYINLKMCENWYTPDKLGRELDLFMSSKVSSRNEINTGFDKINSLRVASTERG